jgi:hypothetical protein
VFLLALTPYQDTSVPGVPFNSYGYRPETAFPVVQAVALLRTCRRVYLETHMLPASLRTFVSWRLAHASRCPYGRVVGPRFNLLTAAERSNVKSLHIYAQQYALEDGGFGKGTTHSAWMVTSMATPGVGVLIIFPISKRWYSSLRHWRGAETNWMLWCKG